MAEPEGGCQHYGGVVICSPRSMVQRRYFHCPTCDCRRGFVQTMAMWYDSEFICLGCGDTWDGYPEEGYHRPRPFARNWRADSISRAKKMWARAGTKKEVNEWMRQEVEAYMDVA